MSGNVRTVVDLPVTAFAEILFTTTLQESDRPGPERVYSAVCRCLDADPARCASRALALVAQEAGDHPEETARRMRWALDMAHDVLLGGALPATG